MKKLLKILSVFSGTIFSINALATIIPNEDHPTTFFGPTLKGSYTAGLINDHTAYSLAGELGVKNYRVSGTLGWMSQDNQRLKISAEYLWQNINYAFFSGNSYEWVNQGAIGANYQYDFLNTIYNPHLDLDAYISHAPSKNLSTVSGTYVDPTGTTQLFIDPRRIAGSNADGIAPGLTIEPWSGGKVGVDLNYDNVRYDTTRPPSQDATGFGGTFHISQMLPNDWRIGGEAGVRQPFNNYHAYIDWKTNSSYGGTWLLGLDGAYNQGKHTLPNSWNVGLNINYLMDKEVAPVGPGTYKGTGISSQTVTNGFVDWVATPSVYLPQVLTIVDPRVTEIAEEPTVIKPPACPPGSAPILTNPFTSQIAFFEISAANNFSGSGLTYSMNVTPDLIEGNTLTIDSATGLITGVNVSQAAQVVTATVTATNSCGSASGSFNVLFPGD